MPQRNGGPESNRMSFDDQGRVSEYGHEVMNKVNEACEETQRMVRDNPGSAALVTFGVGLGLGLLLTSMLIPQRRRHWYDNYTPDKLSAQLSEALARVLPEKLSRHI